MHKEIKIRNVIPEDLDQVYEIEQKSFINPYPRDFLNILYNVNQRTFLIAERDGRVLGYVIASTKRDQGHIVSIAIQPSERKKNIGRTLLAMVSKVLASLGVSKVWLEVRKSNVEARKFYELLGFRCSHIIDRYYGNEDALVYFKSL